MSKVNSGQALKISARDWNRVLDKSNESPSGAGFTGFNPTPACMIRVVAGENALPAGSIVAPLQVLYDRADVENRRTPIMSVDIGVAGATQPMMLFEPYKGDGRPVLAVVSGCCWAKVLILGLSHRFASFGDVDGTRLWSAPSGPVALMTMGDVEETGERMVFCNFGVGERVVTQLSTYTYRCYGGQLIQTEHRFNVSGVGLHIEPVAE